MARHITDSLYEPYRRHDRYGDMGEKPQNTAEYLLLALLSVTVLPAKILGALTCLLSFYSFCRLSVLIPKRSRAAAVAAAGKIACRACLFCLGFVSVRWQKLLPKDSRKSTAKPPRSVQPFVIVSNHSSWVDILVHMARFFPSFVARNATKNMLLIGLISQLMGCLYVDRDRNEGMGATVKARIQRAARGEAEGERPILLFPEGTTTNGQFILPFKSGAFLAGCPVQPVILQYSQGRVSPAWESISALRHIWLMLCIPFHTVTAVELPEYVPSKEEVANPALFAENVRNYMIKCSGLKASKATLVDKWDYHRMLQGQEPTHVKKSS